MPQMAGYINLAYKITIMPLPHTCYFKLCSLSVSKGILTFFVSSVVCFIYCMTQRGIRATLTDHVGTRTGANIK